MDQLGQTPSKIAIISLLLSSKAHTTALMKVLNIAHVMQNITINQFDDVVTNITVCRYVGFNDAELPKGNCHNISPYIYVTCLDTLLSRFLMDIGFSLNVIPKNILSQLLVEGA